jgi:hypothetical protein
MRWRLYYENGSVFTDADGTPWDAPRQAVQMAVQEDPRVGYRYVSGEDYFYYEAERGGWNVTAQWGMFDHLLRAARPCVLFGRQMSDAGWSALHGRIKREMGDKEGWLVTEDRRDDH